MTKPQLPSDQTAVIRSGSGPRPLVNTVAPPVQRASTVLIENAKALYDGSQATYGRAGLQPYGVLCEALAALENALGARLFPNGVAAITGSLLAVLSAGDEVLVVDCIYAPTRRFCDKVLARFGVKTRYFHPSLEPQAVLAMATPATKVIVLESPGSLTFDMQDVPAIAKLARERGILTLIDNTWAAGSLFKPLDHGVDISVQSLTKYVGGHSDVFMGSACVNDPKLKAMLDDAVWNFGWSVSPDDAYLMLRGLRTMPTRLARQGESALAIGRWLAEQPEVGEVILPALPGSRGHEIWKRDFSGQNGLIGVVLKPKAEPAVLALLDQLEVFGLGFSWGGFESLALHCEPQLRLRSLDWTFEGPLIRLHIGLEDPEDLKADLRAGLDAFSAT